MKDAYENDLAYIHDAGFGALAGNAASFVLTALQARGVHSGLVVDLGCGSGVLAAALSSAGYDVLGIDLSGPLLALAGGRAPGARFREGSLWTTDVPPCVAVTAIGECFNYLFDGGGDLAALGGLFCRIHGALGPGGLFVFDLSEPGRVPTPGVAKSHAEGPGWAVLAAAEEDGPRRLLTRRITTFRQVGELYRRGHEVHLLRLYPRSEVADGLREAGFHALTLDAYGEARFAPGHVGFLASKS